MWIKLALLAASALALTEPANGQGAEPRLVCYYASWTVYRLKPWAYVSSGNRLPIELALGRPPD